MSTPRKLLFALATLIATLVVAEGVAGWARAIVHVARMDYRGPEHGHVEYDSELGWVHLPGISLEDYYDEGTTLTTNTQRHRASRDYAPEPPEGRTRILFLGDSFTMGFGVTDDDTFPAFVEREAPDVESVNMGMGAWGLDQMYLSYKRDDAQLRSDIVIASVIGHDFRRMELDTFFAPKPVLELVDGELRSETVPRVRPLHLAGRIGDRLATRLNVTRAISNVLERIAPQHGTNAHEWRNAPEERAYAPLADAVMRDLRRLADERGQRLLFTYLASRDERPDVGPAWPSLAPFAARLAERHEVPFLDLGPLFNDLPSERREELFRGDGHYVPEGNRMVALELIRWLREAGWIPGPGRT